MMSQQGRPTLRPGDQGDFSQSSPSSAVHQSPLQQYLLGGGQSLRPTPVDTTPTYQTPPTVGRMYPVSPGYTPVGGYQQGIASQSPAVVSQLQRQLSNPVLGGVYMYTDKTPAQTPPPAYPSTPVVSGATVHHRGQSPSGGPTPLVNPSQSLTMTTPQRRPSGGASMASRTPLATSTTSYIPSNPVAPSPKKSERPRKRPRIEEKPPANEKVAGLRKLICDAKLKQVADLKENYIDNLTELYFLQLGLNLVDFHTWKKRPTPQLVAFLQSGKLDSDEEEIRPQEKRIGEDGKAQAIGLGSGTSTPLVGATSQGQQASTSDAGSSLSQPPPYGIASSITVKTEPSEVKTSTPALAAALSSSAGLASLKGKSPLSPGSLQRLHTRQHSISAVYDSTVGSQEAIMERAKQEAQVMQKVAELRKQGLWTSRRLPKVQEPPRNKAHWDYLLEEMQWLAADFAQERKWKKAGCRKIARMITRYHQEQAEKVKKAEKEEANKVKRTASAMAKMVKEFWQQIEKVVQYKQQSRLDEKRKKALDLHLNFIVDQTEKYSTWLTEGLSKSQAPSVSSSVITSPRSSVVEDDNDFEPEVSDASDDEETIQKEEDEAGLSEEHTRLELEALQQESEIPLEDLIQSLPPEILDEPTDALDESGNVEEVDDVEFKEEEDAVVDDENTLDEQEEHEQNVDHATELTDLAKEGEMSIEELMKKYSGAYESDFEMPSEEDETGSEESGDDDEDEEETEEGVEESVTEESASDGEQEDTEEVGMEYLIDPVKEESIKKEPQVEGPSKEITDIAATAQSLQPTGYTLETTKVKTDVPFLLKHTLREYQHVGLDWLATLNDRKLNGILADEMGLGKTIQTIALLAHLACHHGIWGPHLIVVPTSVMLNWEMELKKWCPAFKILTYYGSQKERKQKRQGWTKTNAFHVCITSYKLVIQDHQSFRRKKWKYLVLDEAQNIKNFKSQRWQTLLNFSSQRRLLLTGTPLQNSLMELWSLMHFLMPNVFQSHREFKEWFANPLSNMIEGSQEYNENLIKRLHKVLRPFLLRRLKQDVEKQMPKKYEHVVMCRLSKRQRFLYDDFMSQAKTKETLATGHFMSVINILMQLRKVCNHPNLFDPRPIISPFQAEGITYTTASLVLRALDKDPLKFIQPEDFHPNLCDLELRLPAFAAHRVRKLATPRPLIEEINHHPDTPERPHSVNMKNYFYKLSASASQPGSGRQSPFVPIQQRAGSPLTQSPVVRSPVSSATPSPTLHRQAVGQQSILVPVSLQATQVHQLPGYTRTPGVVQRTTGQQLPRSSPVTLPRATLTQHGVILGSSSASPGAPSQPITVQIQHTQQGTRLMIPSGQISQLPGLIQIVQTSNGQQILSAAPQLTSTATTSTVQTSGSLQQSTTPSVASTTLIQAVTPMQRAIVTTTSATSAGSEVPMDTGESLSRPSPVVTSPITCTVVSSVLSSDVMAINGKPSAVVKPSSALSVGVTAMSSLQSAAASAPLVATTVASIVSTEGSTVMRPVVRVSPMTTQAIATATGTSVSQLTTTVSTTTTAVASAPKMSTRSLSVKEQRLARFREELKIETIEKKRKQYREGKLMRLASTNDKRCAFKPVYGQDLCAAVSIERRGTSSTHDMDDDCMWSCRGSQHCSLAQSKDPVEYWCWSHALSDMVNSPQEWMDKLKDTLNRFVFVTPSVTAPAISLHTSHPPPDFVQADRRLRQALHQQLSPKASSLHPISMRMSVQFPEARLIQYDCGKLQTLDVLLRQLKAGTHRVLIFTQMTRMLDVLEQFLSHHGHRYLRLDGSTRVEQRQLLMDRFNADRRIFAFILSTRSGGLGINLTGADTVVFYDSDWNPTMDAQAQDRCHRIGQTRDVHIYRLISEMTVEENILKKANQKRLLGSVAIEGGNFTTAFFKQNTISELFNEPSGLESLVEVEKEVVDEPKASVKPDLSETQLEQALGAAEDETDVMAAKGAKAEQKAELAEFDEEIPWDEKEAEKKKEDDESKVEKELAMLEQELRPVERYAVGFVESQLAPFNLEELKLAEEEVATAKQDWELGRLKALKEEEERRAEIEEDEMLFTYTREDAYNQVKNKKKSAVKKRDHIKTPVKSECVPVDGSPTKPQRSSARVSQMLSSSSGSVSGMSLNDSSRSLDVSLSTGSPRSLTRNSLNKSTTATPVSQSSTATPVSSPRVSMKDSVSKPVRTPRARLINSNLSSASSCSPGVRTAQSSAPSASSCSPVVRTAQSSAPSLASSSWNASLPVVINLATSVVGKRQIKLPAKLEDSITVGLPRIRRPITVVPISAASPVVGTSSPVTVAPTAVSNYANVSNNAVERTPVNSVSRKLKVRLPRNSCTSNNSTPDMETDSQDSAGSSALSDVTDSSKKQKVLLPKSSHVLKPVLQQSTVDVDNNEYDASANNLCDGPPSGDKLEPVSSPKKERFNPILEQLNSERIVVDEPSPSSHQSGDRPSLWSSLHLLIPKDQSLPLYPQPVGSPRGSSASTTPMCSPGSAALNSPTELFSQSWSNRDPMVRTRRPTAEETNLHRESECSDVDVVSVPTDVTVPYTRSRASSQTSSQASSRASSPAKSLRSVRSSSPLKSFEIATRRRSRASSRASSQESDYSQ